MARRTRGRASTRQAATQKSPTPLRADASDEEMQDTIEAGPATPQEDEAEEQDEAEEMADEQDDDEPTTPRNGSEMPSRNTTPARGQSSIPRKRRAGRPPKNRPKDWDQGDDADSKDGVSDVGTPKKRGGWRGGRGFGGGRWAKYRAGQLHASQVPLDKEGKMANIVNDEVELPDDAEGERKVDKLGNLLGGREYRVRVFTIVGKGERLYMLSTEPARCIGFRDSYLFFQKHKQLYKIILPEEAKRDLIERSLIPHSYKGRAIGVVTARSVYREFGARIVIGGRRVVDDYQVAACRAHGDVAGELAVPEDQVPTAGGQHYDRNRYVAWHGASSVYHSGNPSIPQPLGGKVGEGKKRRIQVTGANWMYEHAQAASRFNSTLTALRRQNNDGVFEVHTNQIHYPRSMQPTHVKWEQIPTPPSPQDPSSHPPLTKPPSSSPSAPLPNGYNTSPSRDKLPTIVDLTPTVVDLIAGPPPPDTLFPPLKRSFANNFLTVDTCYRSAPTSNLGVPGPDGDVYDLGPRGLGDVADDVVAELPEECRRAFLEARAAERAWRRGWGTEGEDGARAELVIGYSGM